MPRLTSLDHLVLTVKSIRQTTQFYTEVLGMQAETFFPADGSTRTALKFGDQKINLHEHGVEFDPKSHHPTPGAADLCFLTKTPLDDWQNHLQSHEISILEGPVKRSGATGPILSIYIRDPDQNLIEISISSG